MGWRVGVDGESLAVDDNMVVEPADGGEVLRISTATIGPSFDVVDLGPVAARTARDGARCTVTSEDESSQAGWDHPAATTHREWDTVRGAASDLDDSVA